MRRAVFAAFAAATVLSGGLRESAGAVTFAAPSALGVAAPDTGLIEQVTVVCGTNGCSQVQTKRVQHRKPLHH
jgi:hypothetical protein